MNREGITFGYQPADNDLPLTALPLEYRYRTGLAGCLFGGLVVLTYIFFFGSGAPAFVLALVALFFTLVGLAALLADPGGFLHSMGKKLIITDDVLEEVDEQSCVRWQLRCGEVSAVRVAGGAAVLPWSGNREWRADGLVLATADGRTYRIPVWLLPRNGASFLARLDAFMARGRGEKRRPKES